ncbi:MAG: hypothetical protein ACLT3H_06675 [Roseburia sp.]
MATWIAHLRVAEKVLEYYPNMEHTAFLVGNIAPDSGVPSEDWSTYTPDKNTSHFQERGVILPERFLQKYMTKGQWSGYDAGQRAFYLGYYTPLLSDCLWRKIYTIRQWSGSGVWRRRSVGK